MCQEVVAGTVQAYKLALDLLPKLAWLGLPISNLHCEIINAGNVTSHATAMAIKFGKYDTVIEWLEQGRSIVWGHWQLLKLHTPFDELREQHPRLAAQLAQVSSELEAGSIQDYWAEPRQCYLYPTSQIHFRESSRIAEVLEQLTVMQGSLHYTWATHEVGTY
jgi:hypothetical protein